MMLHELINTFIGDKQWMGESDRPSDIDWAGAIDLLERAAKELAPPEPADFAQHILKSDKKRREYDYAEIEDRLRLKMDTLRDRLQHLTAGELEAVEGCISCAVRLIDLFRRRNRAPMPSDSPTDDERPTEAELGPCTTLGPDKQPAASKTGMCGRCYDDNVLVFPANCAEKPEKLAGQSIGQYHCPDCGAMVMAGMPHPDLCQKCIDRKHPGFDKPPTAFDGESECPLPLVQNIESVNFSGLIKLADKFVVPHDEDQWLDDEWPDKEDELRVAVAEAMGKVGK